MSCSIAVNTTFSGDKTILTKSTAEKASLGLFNGQRENKIQNTSVHSKKLK
jgi:hypothetical protein